MGKLMGDEEEVNEGSTEEPTPQDSEVQESETVEETKVTEREVHTVDTTPPEDGTGPDD